MNADRRLADIRRRIADSQADAFLVSDVPNVQYLTGFEDVFDDGANVACVITTEIARVYTDSRYAEAAEEAVSGTSWVLRVPAESLYIDLCDETERSGVAGLALESSVPYGRFKFISERFGGRVEVVDGWVEHLRQVKEAGEVERIAAAAALTDRTFDHILGFIAPGMRESEIGLELEVYMRTHGAEGIAFPPIVASGPNSSRPHAGVSERVVEPGDLVTLDFGAKVHGYCSDMTRTVAIGAASSRQRQVYEAVLAANETGIAAVRAGVPGTTIDAAAREVLAARELGEYFMHGLGHGVGLEVHELPSVSARGRESVPAGSVITIEPGCYLPGFGGVRIEDLVLVEESGCRVLSSAPKHLIEI